MYELAISLLNQYVEVYTYLTKDKLYGEIISATPYEIILLRRHIDKASNKNYTLYTVSYTHLDVYKRQI